MDRFLIPFCEMQKLFSGSSPIVGFAILVGLFIIGAYFLFGEDKGIGTSVIKWLIGGALLVGGSAIVTRLFGISMGCAI